MKIPVVLATVAMCIGMMSVCTSIASASWSATGTYAPSSAYVGDTVTYTFDLENTGTSSFQVNSATLSIDWGSVTTTRTMTGAVAIAPDDSGRLTCSFKVPQVAANTYAVSIEVEGKAIGDLWATTKTYTPSFVVKPIPTLSVTVQSSVTSGQAPMTTSFTCTPSGVSPYTYHWTFGDGSTSSQSSVSHQYSKGGTYTATCLVTDSKGQTASDSVTITVSANPTDITDNSGGTSPMLLIGIGVVVVAVIVIVVMLAMRKKT